MTTLQSAFLPLEQDGRAVYARFSLRLNAWLVDSLLWSPFLVLFFWPPDMHVLHKLITFETATGLYLLYRVALHARWGATLGKLAVGIRVTLPDGSAIGWGRAWLRESVDILFMVVSIGMSAFAIGCASAQLDDLTSVYDALMLLGMLQPEWGQYVNWLSSIWGWGTIASIWLIKRRRALHDFIAGTVVVRKEFTQSAQATKGDVIKE